MTTKPPNKHVYFAKARAQAKAEEFRLLLIEKDKRIKVLTEALLSVAYSGLLLGPHGVHDRVRSLVYNALYDQPPSTILKVDGKSQIMEG